MPTRQLASPYQPPPLGSVPDLMPRPAVPTPPTTGGPLRAPMASPSPRATVPPAITPAPQAPAPQAPARQRRPAPNFANAQFKRGFMNRAKDQYMGQLSQGQEGNRAGFFDWMRSQRASRRKAMAPQTPRLPDLPVQTAGQQMAAIGGGQMRPPYRMGNGY